MHQEHDGGPRKTKGAGSIVTDFPVALALRSSICAAESVFPPSLFEKRAFPVSHAGEARFVPYVHVANAVRAHNTILPQATSQC